MDATFIIMLLLFLVFAAVPVIIIGAIVLHVGKRVAKWASDTAQPERSDEVRVVSKRTSVSGGGNSSTWTTYYATFELSGGERKELEIPDEQFGLLAEGDPGSLKHQGTRFVGFVRRLELAGEPTASAEADVPTNLVCAYCGSAIPAGKVKCDGCGWTWRPGKPEEADVSG